MPPISAIGICENSIFFANNIIPIYILHNRNLPIDFLGKSIGRGGMAVEIAWFGFQLAVFFLHQLCFCYRICNIVDNSMHEAIQTLQKPPNYPKWLVSLFVLC